MSDAVRAALGGARWRMMRPHLIEAPLLSIAGGVAGPYVDLDDSNFRGGSSKTPM